MKKLTEKQMTQYTRSALGMCGMAVNPFVAEMVWRIQEGIREKGGDFNVRDAAKIEAMLNKKYETGRDVEVPAETKPEDELPTTEQETASKPQA